NLVGQAEYPLGPPANVDEDVSATPTALLQKKLALRDDLRRTGKVDVAVEAQIDRAGRRQHAQPRTPPAPRSQKRTSMLCSSTTFTNDTLVRLGKCGWRSISAPSARQSKSKCSTG